VPFRNILIYLLTYKGVELKLGEVLRPQLTIGSGKRRLSVFVA